MRQLLIQRANKFCFLLAITRKVLKNQVKTSLSYLFRQFNCLLHLNLTYPVRQTDAFHDIFQLKNL